MKYAVAGINFFDNVLIIEIIDAENWKEALAKHPLHKRETEDIGDVSWLPDDMEEAKIESFNADQMFDIIEVE